MATINEIVGEKVFNMRQRAGYNQDELSSAIGLTRTSIVNIEKGRQSLTVENLLKMCAVLKCRPIDILPKIPTVKMIPKQETVKVIVKKQIKSTFNFNS